MRVCRAEQKGGRGKEESIFIFVQEEVEFGLLGKLVLIDLRLEDYLNCTSGASQLRTQNFKSVLQHQIYSTMVVVIFLFLCSQVNLSAAIAKRMRMRSTEASETFLVWII